MTPKNVHHIQAYQQQQPFEYIIQKYKRQNIRSTHTIASVANFEATKDELAKAKQLCHDVPFDPPNIDHVKQIDSKLYTKCKQLFKTYRKNLAKHQHDRVEIPNHEFKIDLYESSKGQVFNIPQYHLNEDKRLAYIYHTLKNIESGIYIPNNTSLHNVPATVIQKKVRDPKTGKISTRLRLALDLRLLNKHTIPVKSQIPTFQYIYHLLAGPGLFSVFDLKNFFECIKLRVSDRDLVHITTPIGEFNLTCGTYGFKGISQTAQIIANQIVRRLRRAGAYVDDIFIKHQPNATPEQLYKDIEEAFEAIADVGVLINPTKLILFVEEIEYLGYIFNQIGTQPTPEYIQKILTFKKPQTLTELKSFLGVIQYITRWIYRLADLAQPINQLTHKNNKIKWGQEHEQAFKTIQERVRNIKLLYHPTPDGQFLIQADASKYAVSGVLYQQQYDESSKHNVWRIIEFYSKQLESNMIKHPIQVKECYALVHALIHWKAYTLRTTTYVDTDHKNLEYMFEHDSEKDLNIHRKQAMETMRIAIMPYSFKPKYLEGKHLILADYLSRDGAKVTAEPYYTELQDPQYANEFEKLNTLRILDHINQLRDVQYHPDIDLSIPILKTHSRLLLLNHKLFQDSKNLYKYELFTPELNAFYQSQQHYNRLLTLPTPPEPTHTPFETAPKPKSILKNAHNTYHTITYTFPNVPKTKQAQQSEYNILLKSINADNYTYLDEITDRNLQHAAINSILNNPHSNNNSFHHYTSQDLYNHRLCAIQTRAQARRTNNNNNTSITESPIQNTLPEPNYNINDTGLRRSLRKRNKPTSFYDQQTEEANAEERARQEQQINEETKENEKDHTYIAPNVQAQSARHKLFDQLIQDLIRPNHNQELLDPQKLRQHQANDPICAPIIRKIRNPKYDPKPLKSKYKFILRLLQHGQFLLQNNILYIKPDKFHSNRRIVIPMSLIETTLEYTHKHQHFNHPGKKLLQSEIEKYYWWYRYPTDIKIYIQQCWQCQSGKGTKNHKLGKLSPIYSKEHNEYVHFDFAGPIHKKLSILVMIDHYTGQVIFHPTYSQSSDAVIEGLLQRWIPIHGLPKNLVTDRGSGFISELNQKIYKLLGINKLFTSSYHPQTNGKAERMVQELKKALAMVNITINNDLTNHKQVYKAIERIKLLLPSIQFSINQRVRAITNVSPNMLLYGHNLNEIPDIIHSLKEIQNIRESGDFRSYFELIHKLNDQIQTLKNLYDKKHDKYVQIMKEDFDYNKYDPHFEVGDYVAYYVGDRASTMIKLRRRFTGPWKIIQKVSHNTYTIENPQNEDILTCHGAMLKLYDNRQFVPFLQWNATYKEKTIQNQKKRQTQPQLRHKKSKHQSQSFKPNSKHKNHR